jgi:hypothetical protein
VFDEQVGGEKRKAGGSLIEAGSSGALKPCREVVTPHAGVASGRYQQAEFAADLWHAVQRLKTTLCANHAPGSHGSPGMLTDSGHRCPVSPAMSSFQSRVGPTHQGPTA